jgi:hypothetical protein
VTLRKERNYNRANTRLTGKTSAFVFLDSPGKMNRTHETEMKDILTEIYKKHLFQWNTAAKLSITSCRVITHKMKRLHFRFAVTFRNVTLDVGRFVLQYCGRKCQMEVKNRKRKRTDGSEKEEKTDCTIILKTESRKMKEN